MAFWDFIKELRMNQEEEQKRREQGGFKNSVFGFLDDTMDTAGDLGKKYIDINKKGVGAAAGLGREMIVKPAVSVIASAEEKQQDNMKDSQMEVIKQLKDLKPEEREDFIKNNPVLANRMKDGKLEFRETTDPWLFGNIFRDKKTMATVDVKDNSQLDKLVTQIEEKDKANDKGRQSTNFVDRQIFGNEPIQAYQNRAQGLQDEAGWSPAMAFAGTAANVALDVPGFGTAGKGVKTAGKEVIEQLVKEGGDDAVKAVLKKTGSLADDVIEKIAPTIARSQDANAIDGILKAANSSVADRAASGKTASELLDDALKSADVPKGNQVNINPVDDFVNAADQTPPRTTPPVNQNIDPNAEKAYQEFGERMKTSDEIEQMKTKKSWKDRMYEGFFNENAPLDVFNRIYKERTGKDLIASQDPAKILQQRYGIEEEMKAYIQPTADALGQLKDKSMLDAVRKVGEARQLLDKSNLHNEDTVAMARQVIQHYDQSFSPQQKQLVEGGIKAVQDHSDRMMRMLVDSGDLTEEAYQAIKTANPNFFSKRNVVEYMLDNPNVFSTSSSNVAKENILKAVKGIESDEKYMIQDPIESLVGTTQKVLERISKSRQFDAARALQEVMPEVVVPLRNAEDVLARFDLAYDNREMRKVAGKLDRFGKTQAGLVRKLQTEINRLNKQGLNTALKQDGKTMPQFTVDGLGGKVPTSKTTTNQLGPQDTSRFLKSLVEGDNKQLSAIRRKIANRDPKLAQLVDELYGIKAEYDDVVTGIKSNSEEMKRLQDADVPDGFMAVSRQKNGVTERIALPKEIAETWAGMNQAQRDTVGRFSRYFSKPIRASVTTLSLPFQFIKNPIRDARQTAFTSKYIPVGEYVTVLPYMKRWAQGFYDAVRDTDFAQEIRKAGGGGAGIYNDYRNAQNVAKNIQRSVSGPEIHNPKDLLKEATHILGRIYGKVEGAGRALEYAPRLAEARAAYKKTGDITEAANAARNVTVDFSRFGKEGRVLNDYLLFLNTRMQGNKNVISGIKRDPKRAAVAAVSNIAMPMVGIYLWNKGQFGDVYDQISQDTKDNNFVLILGDEQDEQGNFTQVLKIPKNEPDKFFGNITQAIIDGIAGEQTDQSVAQKVVKTGASVLPVDVQKDGKFNLSRTVGSLMPQPIKVPAELAANKNFYYDSPIVSESKSRLPNEMQVKTNDKGEVTTPTVDQFMASLVGGSPLKAQHLRQSVTGQLLSKNPASQVGGAVVGADSRQVENQFYSTLQQVQKQKAGASQEINDAIEAGDYTRAREIADQYNEEALRSFVPWYKKYGKYANQDMAEQLDEITINLSSRSINQRRRSVAK
jgi:hypothetical protein